MDAHRGPSPETLTCPEPRVVCIECGSEPIEAGWLESILRQTDTESVRFCHTGGAPECGSLIRLIRSAHEFPRVTELFINFAEFPCERIPDLIVSRLDLLHIVIRAGGENAIDALRPRLEQLFAVRRRLASESPEVKIVLETTAADCPALLDIAKLASEAGITEIVVHPDAEATKTRRLATDLDRIRREFPFLSVDASTCEDDPQLPLDTNPRFTGRAVFDRERVLTCLESPWDSIRLLPNGDVVSCGFRNANPLGNAKRETLHQIWTSARYEEFRRRFQMGEDPACASCPRKLAWIPSALHTEITPRNGNTVEFADGWHWSEGKIIWSRRRSRCLLAAAPVQAGHAQRSVEIEGLLPGGSAEAPNELSVWHKGCRVAWFRNPSEQLKAFRVIASFLDPSDHIQLEFTVTQIHRPRASGSADRRDLGFALVSIRTVLPAGQRLPRRRFIPLWLALALGRRLGSLLRRFKARRAQLPPFRPGISVVIPECATADLLGHAISSAMDSAARLDENFELIVVVNGAPIESYAEHRRQFPGVRWLHSETRLGFSGAIATGVRHARFDWVYLLNSDMQMESDALREAALWRSPGVFAISSQVFFADSRRRREETGWTNFRVARNGSLELFDAMPEDDSTVRGHLYGGGGNSLFRRDLLLGLLAGPDPYSPAYWEDVEWGVRAWRAGYEALFCPRSKVVHVHRATVSRLFTEAEVNRIWKRNQLLFTLRNGFAASESRTVIRNIRSVLDPQTQGELTTFRQAAALFHSLVAGARAPMASIDLHRLSGKYYLRPPRSDGERRTALFVSPFAVYPPAHGSARRTASLIETLSAVADVILLSDEESAYRLDEIRCAQGPISIHLAGGRQEAGSATDRISRIRSHSHDGLRKEMERLAGVYKPAFIQIEHVELAGLLVSGRLQIPSVLDLHDVLLSEHGRNDADRFEQTLFGHYDAIVTCSEEDARLVDHRRVSVLPNGFRRPSRNYHVSRGRTMLFAGPFRYRPNLEGIVSFLEHVYPWLREDVTGVELVILGGNGARDIASRYACFAQAGVTIIDRPVEIGPWLERCALTLNPLAQTRGSCVKVIESIAFGRVCVSTDAGARGFRCLDARSLVTVPGIQDFHLPLRRLLLNEEFRVRLEQPDQRLLCQLAWENIGRRQLDFYREWFGLEWQRTDPGGAPVRSLPPRQTAAGRLRES